MWAATTNQLPGAVVWPSADAASPGDSYPIAHGVWLPRLTMRDGGITAQSVVGPGRCGRARALVVRGGTQSAVGG